MDVFVGAGGSQQVHDYNPGEENGLFWTVPIPSDSVDVDLDDGTAALDLRNFLIDDYGNVGNAISGGKEIGTALLSMHIRWGGSAQRFSFINAGLPTPFRARGFKTRATMTWSAVETIGGVTHTVRGAKNQADFGMVARERNGIFFSQTEDDENDDGGSGD
ncbi:MAG: hypothetical protein JF922_10350 [Candidatus Dormibacteraeota bacterium]|uniref:Uncharacterized protein n=1 Tax=Candidatus Nephthysia bennettiae TaxID=3127016 RepID=A0A934KA46_9BACT|nr:hypothetical protein [Candidatus Dormibacteraeota bacterium]MBJ7612860.1 hypothetical protein [Candidatus Dormibacteraeota bacterium]